jgi:hypothetical protein
MSSKFDKSQPLSGLNYNEATHIKPATSKLIPPVKVKGNKIVPVSDMVPKKKKKGKKKKKKVDEKVKLK